MSKVEAYKIIISQFLAKTLDERAKQNFANYLNDPDFLKAWQQLMDEGEIEPSPDNQVAHDNLFKIIIQDKRIKDQVVSSPTTKKSSIHILQNVSIAAILLLVGISASIFFFMQENRPDDRSITNNLQTVVPGSQKAEIILESGEHIDLEKLKLDTIIDNGAFEIIKSDKGIISYRLKNTETGNQKTAYNTIVTPRGGEYKLLLADGTKIWLNAATTLRYPISFNGDERKVQLQGEAYFEVSKQVYQGRRVPFIVHAGNQKLEVLGTAFNLQNYGKSIVTTLVEGSVKLNVQDSPQDNLYLSPAEQAVFQFTSKKFLKTTVDPRYFIAWKEGKFAFYNTPIDEVMDIICRWYDVEAYFDYRPENFAFSGTVSRYDNIDKLLRTIELVGDIHFELKGRKIYVKR
ncbi:FecR family protein [Sphingobacterium sp. WOUb80]|uniref:FecR family protein n=1 Tax=Sphingobacterium sp. WOUb80 TaxID=3234028 RepID=UPI003CF4FD09